MAWIQCSERLPDEKGKNVLVAIDYDRIRLWAGDDEDGENFRFYNDNYSGPIDVWNPIAVCYWAKQSDWLTHWQPLPEPPDTGA